MTNRCKDGSMLIDGCEDCGREDQVFDTVKKEEDHQRKIRTFQACQADRKTFVISIPSSSDPETMYEVSGSFVQGEIGCTCPGFKFRETCKHLRLEVEECGWNGLDSPEPQTLDQKENHVCPRCGSHTVDSLRGDF